MWWAGGSSFDTPWQFLLSLPRSVQMFHLKFFLPSVLLPFIRPLFFLSVGGRRDGQFIQQEDGHSSEEILPSVFPQYTTHYPYRLLCELTLIWLVQSCFLFPCVVLCCSHPGKQMTMAVGGTSQPLVKNLNKNVKAKEVKKTRTRQRQKLKESRKERNI